MFDYRSEESFGNFVDIINGSIEGNCTVDDKLISKSKRNKLYNLWITNGIICSIKKKFTISSGKKTCSKDNKLGSEDLYKIYKDYRFELRIIIRAAKKEFYHRKFENVKGDMKKTWKLINELRGNNKDKVSTSFVIDGKLVLDHCEISNEFNLFFSSIARKINSKVYSSTLMNSTNEITTHGHRKYFERSVCNGMFFNTCTAYEISEIVKELENGKASDIPIIVIKKCSTIITEHICGFMNNFIEIGIFPDILTPIFKKGDSRFLDNYRPVSTLPIFCKIYEKLIFKIVHSFLSTNNIIYENQFGFRKNHSTSHAVNFAVNKVLWQLENKNHIIGIFIDLSKAFDTISHDKLLDKLKTMA